MKKRIKLIALLTVLVVTVTGCTKEDVADNMGIVATIHSVTYIVDGQQYYANPQTDGEVIYRSLYIAENNTRI